MQAGQTALMLAVSRGKVRMVQLLLQAGADVNLQDEVSMSWKKTSYCDAIYRQLSSLYCYTVLPNLIMECVILYRNARQGG